MSKYIILYRIKNEYDGCRYIELNNDGTIHVDYSGELIVSNANCMVRINEDFEDVETWVTKDMFDRMKNGDGETYSDVVDMIANGEHEEFETYVRESEIEKMCEEYALDEEDVEEVLDNYNNNNYFDMSVISCVWNDAYDIAENYVDECYNIESWLTNYIDYEGLGEAIVNDGYYYTLSDGRVVQYNY